MRFLASALLATGPLPSMLLQSAALQPPPVPPAGAGEAPARETPRVRVESSHLGQELIVDGTFASLYVPDRVATHNVWDALAAPLLALPPERRRKLLVLGLGGGSAARILRALAPDALIVGVDVDREVLEAASSHFGLGELGLEVVNADALDVLRRERRRFDLIVDDVFLGGGGDAHKPDWLPHPGHELALRRLRPGGLLVSNTIHEGRRVAKALRTLCAGLLRIDVQGYWNRIYVAGPGELDARALRRAVRESPVLASALSVLSFRDARRPRWAAPRATRGVQKGGRRSDP